MSRGFSRNPAGIGQNVVGSSRDGWRKTGVAQSRAELVTLLPILVGEVIVVGSWKTE
jgi:hypothetical protein